jgi:hypothetical protein
MTSGSAFGLALTAHRNRTGQHKGEQHDDHDHDAPARMHAAGVAAGALEQHRGHIDRTLRWLPRRGVAERGPPMSTLHERMTKGDPAAPDATPKIRAATMPSDYTEMEN